MQWISLQEDEQQELWNTLEVLMHGRSGTDVRCAQQRLKKIQARLCPYLAPAVQAALGNVVRAAVCASQGGEQRFYWLNQVDSHWHNLKTTLESQREYKVSGKAPYSSTVNILIHS